MAYNSQVKIEWDEKKNRSNREKHGIAFGEAKELFLSDRDYLEIFDEEHSDLEERFIAIGLIRRGVVLVVWTAREENILRIISARWATAAEEELFDRWMKGEV